ncbi:hypothetical protein [Prochlorococcus sp. MIT 0601]|uniref:hypothetical protein n=1 Tax=Prochlorococcus sp. MIT 0601 TaxID=1499498 RepID=UPI00053398B7|nr:hypothetical protein [Prochlorococcus sp. MIT 0601]KGG12689.1 putative protein family PM-9 [Prochlorococcus sp. MIT 0601]
MEYTISEEYATSSRKNAQKQYERDLDKFELQFLSIGLTKIKSNLTKAGLEKVVEIEAQMASKSFEKDFCQKLEEILEDSFSDALNIFVIKISRLYGLKRNKDLIDSFINPFADDPKLDFFV